MGNPFGDGEQDVEEAQRFLKEKRVMQVSGNCDFVPACLPVGSILLNGVRIFFTHGHLYGVEGGDSRLKAAARAQGRISFYMGILMWQQRIMKTGCMF